MDFIIYFLATVLFFVIYMFSTQRIVGFIAKSMYNKIISEAERLSCGEKYDKQAVEKELSCLIATRAKKEKLFFITKIVGIFEFIIFAFLSFVIVSEFNNSVYDIVNNMFRFLGTWLAIKTLGTYNQWSSAIFGRACFYVFLLGTILNITFAILFGIFLFFII